MDGMGWDGLDLRVGGGIEHLTVLITWNIQNGGGDGGGLAGQGGRPCIGICFLRLVVVVVVMVMVIEMVMLVIEMAETVGFVLIFFLLGDGTSGGGDVGGG